MAEKNYSVVFNVHGMTSSQAAELEMRFKKAKAKIAPKARGTSFCGLSKDIRGILTPSQKDVKRIAK